MRLDLESLFRQVADLGRAERQEYYEKQKVPAELRDNVESLLGFDGTQGESLTNCIVEAAAQAFGTESTPGEGTRCGPYALERLLGRGGMGAVFLAHRADGEVEQRVAIKLVRDSQGDPAFRDGFLRERQIQASLSHPGIARLLDAGHTENGQPYFVMEYIEGKAIDEYCQGLEVREKLSLFLKVCDALSYAHRNLVNHRDLKPSNIIVEAGGQTKLLDFGIARMLDDAADAGLTRERLLTPEYASPEQVRGAARTTATDVYSLGAVLYQLLTGRSPHAPPTRQAEAVEVIICSVEPPPASQINRELSKDLDFILGKALRKEAEERYATVEAFASDVQAFLDSRPVEARSGDRWYRTRRFLRRQWLPVSAVALAIVGLSIGLYAVKRERDIGQQRFLQLRQLANQVLGFDAEIRGLPGSTKARQRIVSAAMEYMDGLGKEAHNDRALAMEVAGGYLNLARVQGVPTFSNLGQFAAAEESLRKGDQFVKNVLKASPGDPGALNLEAEIEQAQMILADSQHHAAEALAYTQRCAASVDLLVKGGRASRDQLGSAAAHYINVGLSLMNQHKLDEAIRYTRQGLELEKSMGASPQTVAVGLSLLANVYRQAGDLNGALTPISQARNIAEKTQFKTEMDRMLSLYTILWRQGQILGSDEGVSLGRPEEALEPLQKAFELMEQAASKDPNDGTSRDRLATAALQLGDVLRHRDPMRALAVFDRAVIRQREMRGNVRARREEARLLARSSYPLRQLHREREAQQRIDAAIELLRATKDYPAPKVVLGDTAEYVIRALGDQEAETGHVTQAIGTYRGLLEQVLASKPHPRDDLRQANDLSRVYLALARLYRRVKQLEEADRFKQLHMDLWREWDRKLPANPFVQRQLASNSIP